MLRQSIRRLVSTTIVCLTAAIPMTNPTNGAEGDGTTGYQYVVMGTSTKEPGRKRPWSVQFDSYDQAVNRLKEIKHDYYGSNGPLLSSVDKPTNLEVVKIAKQDASKQPTDKKDRPPKKPNMKPGDVLKEYERRIERAYEKARDAKLTATHNVRSLTEKQFRDVNNQIDAYNKYREEVRVATGSFFNSAPQLTRIDPSVLPKQTGTSRGANNDVGGLPKAKPQGASDVPSLEVSLVGTSWTGEYRYPSGARGPVSLVLDAGGKARVTVNASADKYDGQWTRAEGQLTLRYGGQTIVFFRSGNTLSGRYVAGDGTLVTYDLREKR